MILGDVVCVHQQPLSEHSEKKEAVKARYWALEGQGEKWLEEGEREFLWRK